MADVAEEAPPIPPRTLIKGERREIEEELANRVLSDISEEDADELRHNVAKMTKQNDPGVSGRIIFLDRDVTPTPQQTDDSPTGAPVVKTGLHALSVTYSDGGSPPMQLSPGAAPRPPTEPRAPRPASAAGAKPGVAGKGPVKVRKKSPTREAVMEVIIDLKRGQQSELPPQEEVGLTSPPFDARARQQARSTMHEGYQDHEFDVLMAEVEKAKNDIKRFRNATKLQPDPDFEDFNFQHDFDFDEYDWESYYQQGPETYLMSTHNATLSARIRDYRRELWGDAAPLVNYGILGWRNRDISIRERRRFSDVIREDTKLQKSMSQLDNQINKTKSGGIRRVHSDCSIVATPAVNVFKRDGTYAPVFQTRLKDTTFSIYKTATFTCQVIGNPRPDIKWYHNEALIVEDARHQMSADGNKISLTVNPAIAVDTGAYTCHASNDVGESSTSAQLKLGDGPEPPSRPDVELASDTEVFMMWDPPDVSNGLEVLSYKLEYRQAGDDQWTGQWQIVSEDIEEEAVVLRHLEPQGIYQFRVAARNIAGWGEPSLSSRIIRTHPKGAPKLNVDVLKAEASLSVLHLPSATAVGGATALSEIREEDEECEAEEGTKATGDSTQTQQLTNGSVDSSSSNKGPVCLNVIDKPEDRFEFGPEIFRGRFSLVREAIDRKGGHCSVKCILTQGEQRNDSVHEFELLRELRHENIVNMIAAYVRDDFVLLFLEKLHEPIFHRFCSSDYYTENSAAKVSSQLLSAIQWMHFQGVAHLDIRPENIMFVGKRSWNIKVIDTGSAIQPFAEDGDKRIRNLDPEFTAPEVLKTKTAAPIADMWNFGVVVFMLLSGFHPFRYDDDDTDDQVLKAVTSSRLDLDLVFTNASQESLRLVTWALKKHPHRRMNPEEGLQHRWLSCDSVMVRRREMIKYSSNRLRKLTYRYEQRRAKQASDCPKQLIDRYGVVNTNA